MKITRRLSLQFTLISGIMLSGIFYIIYLLSAEYVHDSFYKLLEVRALLTAQVYLEKDELTKKKFQVIEKAYEQSIPGEHSNIYDQDDRPVFIEEANNNRPPSLFALIKKKRIHRFSFHDEYALGIFYPDNQGDFIIIVTAKDIAGAELLEHLIWTLAGTFLFGLLVILLAGQWYAGRALSPIKKVNQQIKNIRATNLHHRVVRSRNNDEIDELATNFNSLLEHLQSAFEVQRSFVSNASHELRTPLTTIIGELEVTLHKERKPDEYIQMIHTVLDEAVQLKLITDGLLQLTQVEHTMTVELADEIDLPEMLKDLRDYWAKRNLTLTLSFPDDVERNGEQITVKGSNQLLLVAVQNIIKNAFKFSVNAPVNTSLSYNQQEVSLSVSDTGIGIMPEDTERILQPLFRARNAHNFQGHGIGLSIAHRILLLHGARLQVHSEPEKGSVFVMLFPRILP